MFIPALAYGSIDLETYDPIPRKSDKAFLDLLEAEDKWEKSNAEAKVAQAEWKKNPTDKNRVKVQVAAKKALKAYDDWKKAHAKSKKYSRVALDLPSGSVNL